MEIKDETHEGLLDHVNTYSKPSDLRITDIRFADITDAPFHLTLVKVYTNQGLVGYGEVRENGSKNYALMLKSRLLGENPCNVDKLFRRIKQFGGHSRQAGGVCGIEIALWDLAGKAYGVPVYQMLGGKFRDKVRIYCDTGYEGKPDGKALGKALKERVDRGFTFLKMDLGISMLYEIEGALCAPQGFIHDLMETDRLYNECILGIIDPNLSEERKKHAAGLKRFAEDKRRYRSWMYDVQNVAHPFTSIHITEKGLDILEQYLADARSIVGYDIPLAVDHTGHIPLEDCIRLCKRLEKYNLAWVEDMLPWQYTQQYEKLSRSVSVPLCTGEDIYLKENFRPLLEAGGIAVVHPDLLTSGGILENKKIGDMAQEYGVAMAVHMADSPIACMAAVHSIAATENFLALEFHSADIPWWGDLIKGLPKPLVQNGFVAVPDTPGLGIEALNEELIRAHIHPGTPGIWEPTDSWDDDWRHDRIWS